MILEDDVDKKKIDEKYDKKRLKELIKSFGLSKDLI